MEDVRNRPNQEKVVFGPNVSQPQGYMTNPPK